MLGDCRSVLIVSKEGKAVDFVRAAMPPSEFYPVLTAASAAEARRTMLRTPIDILVINIPLPDEFGTKLAETASRECGVVILVKPELYERAVYKMEPFGVLTLSKAMNKALLYQALKVIAASDSKIKRLEESTATLERKLHELKLVNKAKSFLIEEKGMSEEQAHKLIEKTAMDNGIKKSDAAKLVLKELSDDSSLPINKKEG